MPAPALACSIANAALIAISRATALRAARSSRRVFGRAEAVMVVLQHASDAVQWGAVRYTLVVGADGLARSVFSSFPQDLGLAAIDLRRPRTAGAE